jgi:hypothetical protein
MFELDDDAGFSYGVKNIAVKTNESEIDFELKPISEKAQPKTDEKPKRKYTKKGEKTLFLVSEDENGTTEKRKIKRKSTEKATKQEVSDEEEVPKKKKLSQAKKSKKKSNDSDREQLAPVPTSKKRKTAPKIFSIDSEEHFSLDVYDWGELPFTKESAIVNTCDEYISYWDDKDKASTLIVGVDIGKTHLSIVGIDLQPDEQNPLKTKKTVTHMAYIFNHINKSGSKKVTNEKYFEQMSSIVMKDEFRWVFNASSYRIEQQVEANKGCMCISYGLYGLFARSLFHRKKPLDVKFVSAVSKYSQAPLECDHCAKNELRVIPGITKGDKNYRNRKQLGVDDFECFLRRNKLVDQSIFFAKLKQTESKPDDIADSFWIGNFFFNKETQYIARKKKAALKKSMQHQQDMETLSEDADE